MELRPKGITMPSKLGKSSRGQNLLELAYRAPRGTLTTYFLFLQQQICAPASPGSLRSIRLDEKSCQAVASEVAARLSLGTSMLRSLRCAGKQIERKS